MNTQAILELLADNEHATWGSWMLYLFEKSTKNKDGTVTIPRWAVERWTRQANTEYQDLSEEEKESDRREVRHIVEILTAQEGESRRKKLEGALELWTEFEDDENNPQYFPDWLFDEGHKLPAPPRDEV